MVQQCQQFQQQSQQEQDIHLQDIMIHLEHNITQQHVQVQEHGIKQLQPLYMQDGLQTHITLNITQTVVQEQ